MWNWGQKILKRYEKLISFATLTPPLFLHRSAQYALHHTQTSAVSFLKKHNISVFFRRLHKSESFISRQHTLLETPSLLLLFLSNHFLSRFSCQEPSRLTRAGSTWVAQRGHVGVFSHDTWLISVWLRVYGRGNEECSRWHERYDVNVPFNASHPGSCCEWAEPGDEPRDETLRSGSNPRIQNIEPPWILRRHTCCLQHNGLRWLCYTPDHDICHYWSLTRSLAIPIDNYH
jgi:hypothetical protein